MIYREVLMVGGVGDPFEITVTSTGDAVTAIYRGGILEQNPNAITREAAAQLKEYFGGCRTSFDLPVDLRESGRATPFRLRVWETLMSVPYGESVTYGELASMIGDPKLSRAVGGAVGANPMLILVPCHRVLARDGIGGFSAGLDLKRYLLEIEGVII